jgi:hypothetical protein
MKRRSVLLFAAVAALLALAVAPAAADPNNASGTWELHVEVPNVAMASNGDTLAITAEEGSEFSTHPKAITASGDFTFNAAGGGTETGTWTATDLLSFEFYGCGSVPELNLTLPPDRCGGALKMRVVFTPDGTSEAIPGIITIFCIVGPQAPTPHDNSAEPGEEGMTAVVPGVDNFNKIVSGQNIYIQTA